MANGKFYLGVVSPLLLTIAPFVGDMQLLHRLAFGDLSAPVVACRGVGIGVAHELLHGHQVNTGIHEITGKGAAHIMGGKVGPTGCLPAQM